MLILIATLYVQEYRVQQQRSKRPGKIIDQTFPHDSVKEKNQNMRNNQTLLQREKERKERASETHKGHELKSTEEKKR